MCVRGVGGKKGKRVTKSGKTITGERKSKHVVRVNWVPFRCLQVHPLSLYSFARPVRRPTYFSIPFLLSLENTSTHITSQEKKKKEKKKLMWLTSGYLSMGTKILSLLLMTGPSGSGKRRGFFSDPLIWNSVLRTRLISVTQHTHTKQNVWFQNHESKWKAKKMCVTRSSTHPHEVVDPNGKRRREKPEPASDPSEVEPNSQQRCTYCCWPAENWLTTTRCGVVLLLLLMRVLILLLVLVLRLLLLLLRVASGLGLLMEQ